MKKYIFLLIFIVIFALQSCEKKIKKEYLIIYCSIDENWSAPIFKKFNDKTGIDIKAVYDSEANKSVGLANRLIAEKNNPVADIYWSGEPLQIERLVHAEILQPYSESGIKLPEYFSSWENSYWFPNSFRQRVFVINTNKITELEDYPVDVFDLTNKIYHGKVAMANPRFGSTLFHFVTLFNKLGEKDFLKFMENIRLNKVKVYAGNSQVVMQTQSGNCAIGLTDNDDAQREIKRGAPLIMQEIGEYFPSGISIVAKSKISTKKIRKFVDFIISDEIQEELHSKVPYNYKVEEVLKAGVYEDKSQEICDNLKSFIKSIR